MSNYEVGHEAEQRAARYLEKHGFNIIDTNWCVPAAEVDIIAKKQQCIYFVEVKYRRTHQQGDGFDYITTAKLQHMRRAAELWLAQNNWRGEVTLAALACNSSDNFELVEIDF